MKVRRGEGGAAGASGDLPGEAGAVGGDDEVGGRDGLDGVGADVAVDGGDDGESDVPDFLGGGVDAEGR